jgi:flagellar basal-body rod protein FlgG
MNKFDVISNNIANAGTTGYKKDNVITQSFSEELMRRLNDPALNQISAPDVKLGPVSLGVFVDNIFTDFSTGAFSVTDNPLDLCIQGDGFFAASVANSAGETSEMYTRDGSLTLLNGLLVTNGGAPLVGQSGSPITVPNGNISINEHGDVYVNGEFIDRLKMVSFTDNASLRKHGDNFYTTTEQSQQADFKGAVAQGIAEKSNVNSVREMVDMIAVNRLYDANQRVITTVDATLQQAVSEIGK